MGAVEVGGRVSSEGCDLDDCSRVWGVDELGDANVDADVAESVEEDEVAGLEVGG